MTTDFYFLFMNIKIKMTVLPSMKEFAGAGWYSRDGKPCKHAVDRGDFCQIWRWTICFSRWWQLDLWHLSWRTTSSFLMVRRRREDCLPLRPWLARNRRGVFIFGCKILLAIECAVLWVRQLLVLGTWVTVGTYSLSCPTWILDQIGGIIGQHSWTAV